MYSALSMPQDQDRKRDFVCKQWIKTKYILCSVHKLYQLNHKH